MVWMSIGCLGGCSFDAPSVPAASAPELPDAAGDRPSAADAALPDRGADADSAVPPPLCEDADLVGCYRFEASLEDESPAENHASGPVSYRQGRFGLALSSSTASLVTVAEDASLDVTAFTVEMWIYPDEIPAVGRVGLIDNDGQYGIFILPGGELQQLGGGIVLSAPGVIQTGRWIHVAGTFDTSAAALYVDGSLVAQGPGGILVTGIMNGMVLAGNSPFGDSFIGGVDDVRLWRIALSPEALVQASRREPEP